MREPFEFRRRPVVWAPLPLCAVPHTGEGSQELLCLCGDCHSVGWFASIGCVVAVLETCISSVLAVIVGSAVVIGGASLLYTAVLCLRMRLLSGLRIVCRSKSVVRVVAVF